MLSKAYKRPLENSSIQPRPKKRKGAAQGGQFNLEVIFKPGSKKVWQKGRGHGGVALPRLVNKGPPLERRNRREEKNVKIHPLKERKVVAGKRGRLYR